MKYQVIMSDNKVGEVNTIKEVCTMLGKKVSKKDVLAGKVEGVTVIEEVAISTEDELVPEEVDTSTVLNNEEVEDNIAVSDTDEEEDVDTTEDTDGDTEENNNKLSMEEMMKFMRERSEKAKKEKLKKEKAEEIPFDGEFPEIGTFANENQLKKFFKQLTDDQLDEWLELEAWDTEVKLCDNAPINRMRKCMVIKSKHFPKESSGKSKSKYAKYSTEELMQMALDNDIVVRDCGDDQRILRMYTIVALRDAGLLE